MKMFVIAALMATALLGQAGSAQQAGGYKPPPITKLPTPPQADAIMLYPGTAPGSEGVTTAEQWEMYGDSRIVRNVVKPTITPFLPKPGTATGAAVIVAPGGGFFMLSIDNEGNDVARWLADHGIAAFVLKYRLRPTPVNPTGPLMTMPRPAAGAAPGANARAGDPPSWPQAIADGQEAVRIVRRRAGEWGIDPARIGFLGFSAGAMTTLGVGLGADPAARPNFIAPIYGPLGTREVPADAPPLFAAIAADDPIFATSDLGLVTAWRKAGRPVELHIYQGGKHGFGMRRLGTTSDLWIEQFHAWMKALNLLGDKRG